MQMDDRDFEAAYRAFSEYLTALEKVQTTFRSVGIETGNVDPHPNFAEVIVARRFGGIIQRATNKGYDVLTPDGTRIQVKSLKNSSANLGANGRGWYECTRANYRADGPLIEADLLAIVVFLNYQPYALLTMQVEMRDTFPGFNVKGIGMSHIEKLLKKEKVYPEIQIESLQGVLQ